MDPTRFDALARHLADSLTRRTVLRAALTTLAAAGGFGAASVDARKRKKRCLGALKVCLPDGKPCCSGKCCFGTCGDVCCASAAQGFGGACTAKFPLCCPASVGGGCGQKGCVECCPPDANPEPICCGLGYNHCCPAPLGGCCQTGFPVCCPAAGPFTEIYCCPEGTVCDATAESGCATVDGVTRDVPESGRHAGGAPRRLP